MQNRLELQTQLAGKAAGNLLFFFAKRRIDLVVTGTAAGCRVCFLYQLGECICTGRNGIGDVRARNTFAKA